MRGEGREEEEDIADDVQQMADEDCAGQRIFNKGGTAEEGGANTEHLQESKGLVTDGDSGIELVEGIPGATLDEGMTGVLWDLQWS